MKATSSQYCEILIAPATLCGDPLMEDEDRCAHHMVEMMASMALQAQGQVNRVRKLCETRMSTYPDSIKHICVVTAVEVLAALEGR